MVFYPSSESKQIASQRYSHALWFKDLNERHFNPVLKISELLSRLITVYQFNLNLNRLSYSYYVNQWSGTPVEKKIICHRGCWSTVVGVGVVIVVVLGVTTPSKPCKRGSKIYDPMFCFLWVRKTYTHSREAHFNSSSRCFRSVFNEVKRFCDNA